MKRPFFFSLLLFSLSAVCQPAKDSLLHRDRDALSQKLQLMAYLDKAATRQLYNNAVPQDAFAAYYRDSIVPNNPVPQMDIGQYLGFADGQIPPHSGFTALVYRKNLLGLITITEKYGYPSTSRIKAGKISPLTFIIRTYEFDARLKKLLKQEYKLGNITEKEYYNIKMMLRRKTLTEEDVKNLEKRGGAKMDFKRQK